MKTMFIGSYRDARAPASSTPEHGIRIYLHCLDPDTYVLGDDAGGLCFDDLNVPARIGEKIMQGDLSALPEACAELALFMKRPTFKVATGCIITDTDPSLLHHPAGNDPTGMSRR